MAFLHFIAVLLTLVLANTDSASAQSVQASTPETHVTELRGTAECKIPPLTVRSPSRALQASSKRRAAAPLDSAVADQKSPGRALAYSLSGTVLLAPLFGAGLVAGPAAGHFYAGNDEQAWSGIGVRGGALLTAGIGWGLVLGSTQPTGFMGDPGGGYNPSPPLGDGARKAGIALISVGVAALLGSGAYDIATAWGAAKEYNRSRKVKAQVTPAVGPRGEQVGLSLRFQF
jgi:hypothetical protein